MGRPRGGPRLLAALAVLAAAGCGTAGPDSGDEEWRPWQTTFRAGADEDGAEEYGCVPDLPRAGLLRCSGRGFDHEALRAYDGSPRKAAGPGASARDFGRTGDVLLTQVESYHETGKVESGYKEGFERAEIRAVDPDTRKPRWSRTASLAPAALTSDGAVSTEWRRPDGHAASGGAQTGPGGDLIVRDPATGHERARVPTPGDRWCFPIAPFGARSGTYAVCELRQRDGVRLTADDEPIAGKLTVHRVDARAEKLVELADLAPESAEGHTYDPVYLGGHGGDLLFLLTDGRWSYGEEYDEAPRGAGDAEYGGLLRIDADTGEQRRVPRTEGVPRGSYPKLTGGRLAYLSPDTRTTVVADPGSGERLWKAHSPYDRNSVPVVSPERGEVYACDTRGRLLVRDLKDGKELRRAETARTKGSPGGPLELPSLRLTDGALVVSAGNTVFSVDPKDLDAEPAVRHTVD